MPTAHQSEIPEPDSMTIDPANLGSVDPLSVEGIFLVALGKTGAEREAFLTGQCVDDDQRQRVEALLGAYEKAGNFLQKPAVAAEPTPIGQYLAPCELPGTLGRLGPYEILEEIGRGGMGVVFRAHDPKLQRIVAVKALAPELARLPSARQRFLREARAAAAISHPHVVTIFAVEGTEEASLGTERTTLPFLVMECIVGQTLHDKIKRVGALRLEEIIRISRQMAEGLAAAHKRGLIHRDIKPANILLENGVERVKITDFGLARTTADGGITHTGEILGTPQCMSPEQARGEIVDQRSDLFSLGCVMYTMCTGVSPFRSDNILAVMKKVCEETPRPIAQLNPGIPEWLCEVVHGLLEKDPSRRIPSADNVVKAMESRVIPHVASEGVQRVRQPGTAIVNDGPHSLEWFRLQATLSVFLPEVILLSALGAFSYRALVRNSSVIEVAVAWLAVWLCLFFIRRIGQKNWTWFRWSSFCVSQMAMMMVALLGTSISRGNESPLPLVALFTLVAGTLWLFVMWIRRRSEPQQETPPETSERRVSASVGSGVPSGLASRTAKSPWSVPGWMLVGLMAVGFLGAGLLAVAIILPAYQARQTGVKLASVVVETHGHVISQLTIDGRIVPTPAANVDSQGRPVILTHAGPRTLRIDYRSDNPETELYFLETINANPNSTTVVDAKPIVSPITISPSPVQRPQVSIFSGTSIQTLPLADSVEVLTDPAKMPAPTTGIVPGGFGTYKQQMTQAVWIDEPGLLIRMKRIGFDSSDGDVPNYEYYSKHAWGTGPFMATNQLGEHPHHFPSGRYEVLVQDLDYGWPLDRRGTITIGNSPTYVHVKRTFDAQQLPSSGGTQFPVTFRWAGKSYQIGTPEEVSVVNGLLMATKSMRPALYTVPESFHSHPLFAEAVRTDSEGRHSLNHLRPLARIEIQSPSMQAGFVSSLGRMGWTTENAPTQAVFAPRQELKGFVTDELLGWNSMTWTREIAIPNVEPSADILLSNVRRDRALIRKFAESEGPDGGGSTFLFHWFSTDTYELNRSSFPAIQRLIIAWSDDQPDVPESELMQLGEASSFEQLWVKRKSPGNLLAPEANEKPQFVPAAFLIPGSTPGTWRIQEPPEGTVAPN